MRESEVEPLIRYLQRRDILSEAEQKVLRGLPWRMRDYQPGTELVKDASEPLESSLLVTGFTARVGNLASGERQITGLHIPGDFIDLHSLLLKVMDHSIVALTPCRTASVEHEALQALSAEHPHLWRLLMMTVAIDGAIQRLWIIDLGRRVADKHMARLFCELYRRLEVIGLAHDFEFDFPLTQAVLADVLGLSNVHTNRSLQALRSTGSLEWNGGRVRIKNWQALLAHGGFDPLYLNLVCRPR